MRKESKVMKRLPIVSLAMMMCMVAMFPMIALSSGTSDYFLFGDVDANYSPQPTSVVVAIHNVRTNKTMYEFTDNGSYSVNLAYLDEGFVVGDQVIVEAVDNNAYGGIGRSSSSLNINGGTTLHRADLTLTKDLLPLDVPDAPDPPGPGEKGAPKSGSGGFAGSSCQPPPGDWIITGYVECQNENIIVFDGDLIIRKTGHLRFINDVNLYIASYPSAMHGITIERDGLDRGLFEVWSDSFILPATSQKYSFFVDVYGEYEMSASTISYMYGDATSGGVYFHGGSIGRILSGSEVSYGDTHGIFADGSSESVSLTIQSSTIKNNGYSMAMIAGHGIYLKSVDATISLNDILDNEVNGIHLEEGSSPSITSNTVSDNRMGVGSYSSSPSITSNNVFADNVYGVYINLGSPPTVSGNTFSSNSAYGLYFRYASPLVQGNTFTNNYRGLYGYSTYSDVRDNTASGNTYWGIYLSRSSSDIDENTVSGGQYGMIVAWDMGTPPTVTDNIITDATYGLYIYGTDADVRGTTPWAQVLRSNVHNLLIGYCSPTVQWNRIYTDFVGADPISHVGIHIYPQSSPTIHVNYILNMRYFGIVANNQTSGTISNGYIYSWYWRSRSGVQIYDSTIQVRYNWLSVRIYDIFTQQASATIEYNNMYPFFTANYRGILNYQSTALNVIRGNTITGHQRDGIYDSWSASQIEGNTVTNNYAGVTVYRSTSVVSNNNQLNSNSYYGIRICTPGQAPLVTDNTMNSNLYGVYVYCANSMPTITGNTINSNTEDGLLSVLATPTIGSALNPNTFKFNGGWGIHSQFAAPLNAGTLGATLEAQNIFGRGAEVNALGDIVQEWRVRVYVTHLGVPVADADVTVWQENQYPPEDEVWTGKTNALGYTPWISNPYLKEYEWDNTGTLHERDDHLFLAVKMPEGWTDSDIEKVDHDQITVHLEID